MILSPDSPSLQRWLRLGSARYSFTRSLQYEAIVGLDLEGKTLDIGGEIPNTYHQLIHFSEKVDILNIDPLSGATLVCDLNKPLPIQSHYYDNVISLNTLEHIRDDNLAWQEMFRVLKPGGEFHILIPFLFRVHGDPSDFHRHTSYLWAERLLALGLSEQHWFIRPLVWDRFSSAWSLIEPRRGVVRMIGRPLALIPGLLKHWLKWNKPTWGDYALSYYIFGKKVVA